MDKIIGYVKRNNGIRGPGFAEWDEPAYGETSMEELKRNFARLRESLEHIRDNGMTMTKEAIVGEAPRSLSA